jgi:hypothetical protein
MRKQIWIAAAFGLAISGAAFAQNAGALTAADVRKAIFGVDLRGFHESSGEQFRECVSPNGTTSYWFLGEFMEGRVSVRDDGAVCFAYRESNFQDQACWWSYRVRGNNFRFESVSGSGEAFVTTAAPRVRVCPGKDVPVS